MSDELINELKKQVESLKDDIKENVKSDLGKGYYKMRQSTIITLIGCTITACLTVFGGILYIDRHLNSNSSAIIQCQIDDKVIFNKCDKLSTRDEELQQQINNLYQDKAIK